MTADNDVVGYIKFVDPEFFDKLREGQIHLSPANFFNDHGSEGIRDEYEGKTVDGVGYEETLLIADVPSKNSVIYISSFVIVTKELFDEQGIIKREIAEEIQTSLNKDENKRPFVIFPKAQFQQYIQNEYKDLIRKWYEFTGNDKEGSEDTAGIWVIAPRVDDSIVFENMATFSIKYGYNELFSNELNAETIAIEQFATKFKKYSDQREFRILMNVFYNEELDDVEKKKGVDIVLKNNAHINEENIQVWKGKEYKDFVELSLDDFNDEV